MKDIIRYGIVGIGGMGGNHANLFLQNKIKNGSLEAICDTNDEFAKNFPNIPFYKEVDNFFEAVMCVGTFTFGHVKPPALDEFIRITKNKGLICFTINEGIHEEYGFDKKIAQLNIDNKWKEIEFFKSDYIASKDVNAWLGLYEVIK